MKDKKKKKNTKKAKGRVVGVTGEKKREEKASKKEKASMEFDLLNSYS